MKRESIPLRALNHHGEVLNSLHTKTDHFDERINGFNFLVR
jgi:hypothetical protein